MTDLVTEIERLRQENARLRAENTALRPLVSSLRHNLALQCNHCDYLPHDLKTRRGKARAEATTKNHHHG